MVIFAVVVAAMIMLTPALRGTASKYFPEPASDVPNDRTLRQELRRAAAHKPYWLLNLAFLVCGFHVTFIGTYLPRYGADLGHAGTATTALALIGLFNVFGSLGAGVLGGRFSMTKVLAGIYGMRAVVIATIVFGGAIGTLWLATVPLTSAMVSDMFGTTHAGALFGIVFVSHQIGALMGALGGARAYDAWNSYSAVWWVAVVLGGVGFAAHLLLTEGPAPEPPTSPGTLGRLAPTGGVAAWILIIGMLSMLSLTDAAAAAGDELESLLAWCFSAAT